MLLGPKFMRDTPHNPQRHHPIISMSLRSPSYPPSLLYVWCIQIWSVQTFGNSSTVPFPESCIYLSSWTWIYDDHCVPFLFFFLCYSHPIMNPSFLPNFFCNLFAEYKSLISLNVNLVLPEEILAFIIVLFQLFSIKNRRNGDCTSLSKLMSTDVNRDNKLLNLLCDPLHSLLSSSYAQVVGLDIPCSTLRVSRICLPKP